MPLGTDNSPAVNTTGSSVQLRTLGFIVGGNALIQMGVGSVIAAALPIIAVPALAVGVGVGAAAIRKRMK